METLKPAKSFDEATCTRCGLCFSECPVMDLPVKTAREEIQKLIAGRPTRHVLRKCTSCFACDFICPHECNPAELVLQRWHEQYVRKGLPLRARYYSPHETLNFRTYVVNRMPVEERALIQKWADLSPAEEILFPGCNILTAPFITQTAALEGMDIRGSLDYCCGETYYRMGLFDEVRKVARRMERYFNTLGVRRVNLLCTAGCNMLMNVLPAYGVKFNFEVRPYLPVILKKTGIRGAQDNQKAPGHGHPSGVVLRQAAGCRIHGRTPAHPGTHRPGGGGGKETPRPGPVLRHRGRIFTRLRLSCSGRDPVHD